MKEENGTGAPQRHLARTYVELLHRFRWAVVAGYLALAVLSFWAMQFLVFENSNESFFRENDPAILSIERFRELFGNDDSVAVAVRTDDVFRRETLLALKSLSDTLEQEVPYLWRTSWVGNAEYLSGGEDEVRANPLAEEIPESPEEIAVFRDKATSYPDYVDTLISPDGRIAVITLEFDPYPDGVADPRKEIAPVVNDILARPEFAGLETHLVGEPIQDHVSDTLSATETVKLGLWCLLVQGLLLFRFGRGLRAVLAPLVTILLSIVFTIGIIGALRLPLSMMTIMLPAMLLSVCIGDCVHIVADYHRHRDLGEGHIEAMVSAVRESFAPCLVTSLTTMLGFMSFLATDIVPIRMAGVYSAMGVGIALLLAMTLTPVAYLVRPEREDGLKMGGERDARLDGRLERLVRASMAHPRPVIAFFVLTAATAAALYPRLNVETNYVRDLSTNISLRRDTDFFDERMGGSMSLEIMLDSGAEDGARRLAFLRDVERLQERAERHPLTTKTHSVANTIKRIHEVLHNEEPGTYRLPDSDRQVGECLFFYETSGGKNMDKELSFLSDVARIHVQTRTMSTSDVKAFMKDLDAFVAEELGGRVRVEYTGQMAWVSALSDHVLEGQVTSLLSALASISVMMMLSLRSVRLGLVSMLPNIVPIIVPFGLMYVAGVNISIVLMVFSSVIIGICVDDTTHFYVNFRRRSAVCTSTRQALFETVRCVGRPVTFTTVSLVAGFSLFALSDVQTTVQFGLLAAAAFLWGWLADLTLSPALLTVLGPFPRKDKADSNVPSRDRRPAPEDI